MEPEVVEYTVKVPIVDCDNKPIFEGSVIKNIEDGEVGVVTKIVRADDRRKAAAVGDLLIHISLGQTRVTNNYKKWKHVEHDDQTYEQRLTSWMYAPSYEGIEWCESEDESRAMDAIIRLLPDAAIDWEGDIPNCLEDALKLLVRYLK